MERLYTQFVCGAWGEAGGRERRPVVSPASGREIAAIASAEPDDVARALEAAAAAQHDLAARDAGQRAEILDAMARAVAEHRDRIAAAVTEDQGKPLAEARAEIDGVAEVFAFFAEAVGDLDWQVEDRTPAVRRQAALVPVGPVAVIGTWNFPVETLAVHMAPAIAAGCSTISIANALTPGGPVAFFAALAEAELPPGLVNLLLGNAAACSAALIADPRIRHVSYTGSVAVGRQLAEQAGRAIKRCTLELGGNAPAIVLEGADLDLVVAELGAKRFWNAGQVCTAPNRLFVPQRDHDALVERLGAFAADLVVGDGSEPATAMGPLVSARRVRLMNAIVGDAQARGAALVTGGRALERDGHFWAPTVLGRVPDAAEGMRSEIFGPVACVAPYATLDEAVARANRCDLGLAGYVYGPDPERARAVAGRIEAGAVGVNQPVVAFVDAPFRGVKDSGLGHVGGRTAILEYLMPRLTASRQV